MGVLTGKLPGKVGENEIKLVPVKLAEHFKDYIKFAEKFGVRAAERELEARLGKSPKK